MLHLLLFVLMIFPGSELQNIGRSVKLLTECETTRHFEIHYRPGSRAGASVDRCARMAELEFERIFEVLKVEGEVDVSKPFHLFLYDSVEELSVITQVQGAGGVSAVRESHIPYDNDQTRFHEMVHIVVAAMPKKGSEIRNMFFVEGVANAVLEFVHGIPVHSVAAYEKRRGSLPSLATLAGEEDFYAYLKKHPDFNGYDVGGSLMLFLLNRYDPKDVMDYYHGKPVKKALGVTLREVEKKWHAFLDGYEIRPELEILLKQRRGDEAEFTRLLSVEELLPDAILGKPKDWKAFHTKLKARDKTGSWTFKKEFVQGRNESGSDWSICEVPKKNYGPCILRGTIKALGQCWGVQLRYGDEVQAMVLGQGAFIYYKDDHAKAFTGDFKLGNDQEIDLVLRIDRNHAEVWIDGERLLEADVEIQKAPIGIGLVGGGAEFRNLKVRSLD